MQHILSENTLTVIMSDGTPRSLHRGACGEEAWTRALHAVHADDYATIEDILDKPRGINRYFESKGIEVRGGVLYHGEQELAGYAATKAIEFVEQGLPAEALINFLKRVNENPSYRAVQDLYKFLEFNGMPLTPEGRFMAYKKVRRVALPDDEATAVEAPSPATPAQQLVDIHTSTICNDPGEVVSMPRNKVDENPEQTCSYGLHVCSYAYLPQFGRGDGDTVVMVAVDPADVVAIPHDYHNAKMRVCRYEVIREIPEWHGHTWGSAVVGVDPAGGPDATTVVTRADVPLGCEGNDDDVPGDDLNGARQEREYGDSTDMSQDDIDSMIAEMDDMAKTRLARYVRDVAERKHVPTPLSTEMRIRFLLEHGHSAGQIYNLVFHDL